jgi:hypothetical protein
MSVLFLGCRVSAFLIILSRICVPVIDVLIEEVDDLPQSLRGGEYYFFGQNFERKKN